VKPATCEGRRRGGLAGVRRHDSNCRSDPLVRGARATPTVGACNASDTGYRAIGTFPTPTPTPPTGGLVTSFTFSPEIPAQKQQVQSTDAPSGASTWDWDFGDGTRSSLRNPAHTYAGRGVYTVVLWVSNGVSWSNAAETVTVNGSGRIRRNLAVERLRERQAPRE